MEQYNETSFSMFNYKYSNLNICLFLLVFIFLIQCGCNSPVGSNMKLEDLQSPDPAVKVMAIKWAGENEMQQAVPQLVDLLQHEDRSIRFYSIQSLVRITGTNNGYDYKADAERRSAAVKRWGEFINSGIQSDHES